MFSGSKASPRSKKISVSGPEGPAPISDGDEHEGVNDVNGWHADSYQKEEQFKEV